MTPIRSLAFSGICIFATVFFYTAAAHARVILEERFEGIEQTLPDGTLKLYPDRRDWAFTFWPGVKWKDSYGSGTNWLNNNGECQTYVTPLLTKVKGKHVPPALRYDPFTIKKDGLHITANLLSPAQQKAYHVGGHRRYGSGMLLSRQSFTYGKLRIVAKLPSARGSWPAFWLLPTTPQWPPEIDLLEGMAWGPHSREIHSGFITRKEDGADHPTYGDWYDVGTDPSKDFHEYGLDWDKNTLSASFDGKVLWTRPTPPSMHQPMSVIINLAVGGKWPFNELKILPIDDKSPERMARGATAIEPDYPATMIIKSVNIHSP